MRSEWKFTKYHNNLRQQTLMRKGAKGRDRQIELIQTKSLLVWLKDCVRIMPVWDLKSVHQSQGVRKRRRGWAIPPLTPLGVPERQNSGRIELSQPQERITEGQEKRKAWPSPSWQHHHHLLGPWFGCWCACPVDQCISLFPCTPRSVSICRIVSDIYSVSSSEQKLSFYCVSIPAPSTGWSCPITRALGTMVLIIIMIKAITAGQNLNYSFQGKFHHFGEKTSFQIGMKSWNFKMSCTTKFKRRGGG